MARLIPNITPAEIAVKSERDVAKFLVDLLPNDCIIYHSYPWLNPERDTFGKTVLREGEADFIVVIPALGMLVLEVKGGIIEYDPQIRAWQRRLSNGAIQAIKDPFAQARANTHFLAERIRSHQETTGTQFHLTYGYAVVFPD